jgi:hypothetical protein
MKDTHSSIIVLFVLGNLIVLVQPLNVRIQWVLKQSMKQSAHEDIVNETMAHLDSGKPLGAFKPDKTLGIHCDQCVSWILAAYHDINTGADSQGKHTYNSS